MLLSHHFGIHPWHYDQLTAEQYVLYCEQADAIERDRERGDGG